MHFSLKSYQVLKLKNYFKNKSLFTIFHCSKLNLKEWINTEQKLQKFQLNYYKPLNKVMLKEFKNSIYSNYSFLVNSSVLFVSFNDSSLPTMTLQQIQKSLNPLFLMIAVKLNNNLYSSKQLANLKHISYKQNLFLLHKVLYKSSKTSYVMTQSLKSKQCDLNT